MTKNKTANENIKTRVIPGLKNDYHIVSMPYWAWYWLEDFMSSNKISYHGIYNTFGDGEDVSLTLRQLAEMHHEYAMREMYKLSNDNECENSHIPQISKAKTKSRSYKLPKIYKLFGFMSCATTLEAVWERRHYVGTTKVN